MGSALAARVAARAGADVVEPVLLDGLRREGFAPGGFEQALGDKVYDALTDSRSTNRETFEHVLAERGVLDNVRGAAAREGQNERPAFLREAEWELPCADEHGKAARLERGGDPATLRIVASSEEIGVGDRLIPAERAMPVTYAPHPPAAAVNGRIVSVYRGVAQVGRTNVVALNVGKANGLEVGNVLAILQRGRTVTDREAVKPEQVSLPDRSVGHLLVFRVFDKIAYGLVMEASHPIAVGDAVSNP